MERAKDEITLSAKHGVNPALVKCQRCGKDTGEIALLGRTAHYRCQSCRVLILGKKPKRCPRCETGRSFDSLGEYDGSSLNEFVTRLWEQARREGHGTDWVNEHPVVVLISTQLVHLSRAGSYERWQEAATACEAAAGLKLANT